MLSLIVQAIFKSLPPSQSSENSQVSVNLTFPLGAIYKRCKVWKFILYHPSEQINREYCFHSGKNSSHLRYSYGILFSGSHMLACSHGPPWFIPPHLSFHSPNPSFLFTSSCPYPPSSQCSSLSCLSQIVFSPPLPVVFSLFTAHPSALLSCVLTAAWMSYQRRKTMGAMWSGSFSAPYLGDVQVLYGLRKLQFI